MRSGLVNPRQFLNHSSSQGDWYSIANKTSDEQVDVYLYDEIGLFGTTAADFMRELSEIKTASLEVHISSKGGDIFDGIAIYNALRTHSAPVTTKVDALAASMDLIEDLIAWDSIPRYVGDRITVIGRQTSGATVRNTTSTINQIELLEFVIQLGSQIIVSFDQLLSVNGYARASSLQDFVDNSADTLGPSRIRF